MYTRWTGMFLPVSKLMCSYVEFSLRLRAFFRTESYYLLGTNWYLSTCTASFLSLNFHCDFFLKYFSCRTPSLKGHPERCTTVIPMSHLFSASLSIKFVTDASWLVPPILTEVTSATILLTTTHFHLMSTEGTIHVCQLPQEGEASPNLQKPSSHYNLYPINWYNTFQHHHPPSIHDGPY